MHHYDAMVLYTQAFPSEDHEIEARLFAGPQDWVVLAIDLLSIHMNLETAKRVRDAAIEAVEKLEKAQGPDAGQKGESDV